MTLTDRIARGLKATLIARSIHIVANAALLIALTRYLLTPAEYGQLYFALSVVGVAVLAGTLGLPMATARYVTEYVENNETQVPHLLERSLGVVVLLASLIGLALVLLRNLIAGLLGEPGVAPFLLVGGGYVTFQSIFIYLKTVFQGFNRVAWTAVISSINGVGRVTFAVGFVLMGFGAVGAMAGYVVAFIIAVAVGLTILYWRFYRTYERAPRSEPGLLRRVLEYSVPTTATKASVVLDSKVDTLLLGVLGGPIAVAFYTLARQIAEVCLVPAQSLGFTITPTLGEQKAASQVDRAARLYERSLENVLLLYIPAAVGLVLVAEPAIRHIFSDDYIGAAPIVQLFGVLIITRAVNKITGHGLDYLGLARIRAIARALTAFANVGLNILLIPPLGALGAGVATVITHALYTIVNIYYIHRELDLQLGFLIYRFIRIVVVTLLMAGAVILLLPYVSGVVTLVATVALGGAIWGTLSIAVGLIDPAEVRSFLG